MTQYAQRELTVSIPAVPGTSQMFRLPKMMPGSFHIAAIGYSKSVAEKVVPKDAPPEGAPPGAAAKVALAEHHVAIHDAIKQNVAVGPGGQVGPVGPGDPTGPAPYQLLLDLYHGDQLIVSGAPPPMQQTSALGDDSWRVRVNFPATSQPTDTVRMDLIYTSTLPILARRVPLAYLQQGFDDNWNHRDYISIGLDSGVLSVRFDPEIASYYNLANQDISIAQFGTPNNILVQDIQLRIDSSPGGYEGLPGPLPYIRLTVTFGSGDGQPMTWDFIEGTILGHPIIDASFTIDNFSIIVDFFLTTTSTVADNVVKPVVGYRTQAGTDLYQKITATSASAEVAKKLGDAIGSSALYQMVLPTLETKLDSYAGTVGAALTPWLLGAAYDISSVSYAPVSSQPTPAPLPDHPWVPQGDIVITYVGLEDPGGSSMPAATSTVAPAVLTISGNAAEAVVGVAYAMALHAAGGTAPYTWTIAGTLPPGIVLAAGSLTGSPSALGAYAFQLKVVDAGGASATKACVIVVNTPGFSIATSPALANAVVGDPYATVLDATGGTGVLKWSASGLPPGLSLSAVGVLSGTPTAAGSAEAVIVQVVDAKGATAHRAFLLTILNPLLFGQQSYTPRGAGSAMWAPPQPVRPQIGHIPGPVVSPGNLSKIDHIVVLMMENRSFDHMLGYLSREGGRSDIEGLKWENDGNRTQYNYYNGRTYYPNRLLDTHLFDPEPTRGPDHSFESVKAQMADNMGHFVSDYARNKITDDDPDLLSRVMGYYTGEQLPMYDLLAREFAVCDHWFCSHPGPTWPNRFVTLTGDLNRDSYGEPEVNTPDYSDFTPSEATTIFDLLSDRKVGWQYFEQRASTMRAYAKYTFDMVNVLEYSDPDRGFAASVKAGLKAITFVDPLFGDLPAGLGSSQDNDDAPPSDLANGQKFVEEVVTTLFTPGLNPNWLKTMLVIVYDEHGGFYDHVQPPSDAVPLTGQNSGKLGPRVPAFVVSPWTPAGMVLKDVFDHTSIAATILRRFCSPYPPYLSARVSAARDLRDALPLSEPRGTVEPLFGPRISLPAQGARTLARMFKAPVAADSFGSLLGAMTLMLGKGGG